MYPVVLGSPPAGSLPVRNDWQGLSITWEAPATGPFDESGNPLVWDLTDPDGGVVLTRAGVEGMHNPRITKHSSVARAIPGKRNRGWRAEARDVFWPIYLWADGSAAWLARQAAFFASIHPENPGTWRVKAGDQERTLQLTGVFDDPHQFDRDPMIRGWALYGVTLEAEQPYWQGQRIRRGPWSAPEAQPFIPEGGGPSFTISSSSAFGSATIPNPGDVEVWGVWSASGPLDAIALGVGDAVISVPFSLETGDVLVIDTDPRRPTATLNGIDATEQLGLQDYAPVPPGASVPLHVEATGTGRIMFDLLPLYFRAF